MAEWLDPDNLEDSENTTKALLNELPEESDHMAGEEKFWTLGAEVGNVKNQGENLLGPLRVLMSEQFVIVKSFR